MDFILQLINLCLGDKILVCEKYMFNLYQKRKALILEFPLKWLGVVTGYLKLIYT